MGSEFETYAMRGVVALLGAAIGAFGWREITSKDGLRTTIETNRIETTAMLDRITGQFRSSIDAINSTLATLSGTIGRLDATMAKEYASKDDMKALKGDLQFDIAGIKADLLHHAENCPFKGR